MLGENSMIDLNVVRRIWLKTAAVKHVPWDDPEEIERSPWKEILAPFLQEVRQQAIDILRSNYEGDLESRLKREQSAIASELFRQLDTAQALIRLGEIGGITLPGRSLALPALIYEAARIGGQSHLPPLHIFPFKRYAQRFAEESAPGAWENFVKNLQAELLLYEKLLQENYPLGEEQKRVLRPLLERLSRERVSGLSRNAWRSAERRPLFVADTLASGQTFDMLFGTRVPELTILPNYALPLYTRRVGRFISTSTEPPADLTEIADALSEMAAAIKGRSLPFPEATIRLLPSIRPVVSGNNEINWEFFRRPDPPYRPLYFPLITSQHYPGMLADLVEAAGQRISFTPFLDAARIIRQLPQGQVPKVVDLANPEARLAALGISPEAVRRFAQTQDIRPWIQHPILFPYYRSRGVIKALTSPEVPIEIP
jgi:hypothetical protein